MKMLQSKRFPCSANHSNWQMCGTTTTTIAKWHRPAVIVCIVLLQLTTNAIANNNNTPSSKFGIYLQRQPESTVAPLRDEVLFECALSVTPDAFEWRFQSQGGQKMGQSAYIYLTREVSTAFAIALCSGILEKCWVFAVSIAGWLQYFHTFGHVQIAGVCEQRISGTVSMCDTNWYRGNGFGAGQIDHRIDWAGRARLAGRWTAFEWFSGNGNAEFAMESDAQQ